jgi:hypothetical protein
MTLHYQTNRIISHGVSSKQSERNSYSRICGFLAHYNQSSLIGYVIMSVTVSLVTKGGGAIWTICPSKMRQAYGWTN